MTTESVKINSEILKRIREYKQKTGISITRFIELTLEAELNSIDAVRKLKKKN